MPPRASCQWDETEIRSIRRGANPRRTRELSPARVIRPAVAMEANLGTAVGQHLALVGICLCGRHPLERIAIERDTLTRGRVDPDCTRGLVEPGVADRHQKPRRLP